MNEQLLEYYADTGPERVGIILAGYELVELENVSENPEQGFLISDADLLRLEAVDVLGTWHTHPGASCNLSVNDMEAFLAWPDRWHWIVGCDGVAEYYVENGAVIRQ